MSQLTNTQKQLLQVIANNNEVQHMCAIFATAMLVDDVATVKYIAQNYVHMFNEEQQAAAKSVLADIVAHEQFAQQAEQLATHAIEQAMLH